MASPIGMFPKQSLRLYFVSIKVVPQNDGVDLPKLMRNLSNLLCDYSSATRVLYKLKVSGESRILSVIQVTNIIGLERTIAGVQRQGSVEIECLPIVTYENFARSIKVGDHLTKPNSTSLAKEGLYWLEFDIGYSGKTTDDMIAIWRREAEAVLTARYKEGTSIELYKVVAQRKVHVLINAADAEQVDLLSLQLPIMQENGANVTVVCKSVQFLEDYVLRFTADNI